MNKERLLTWALTVSCLVLLYLWFSEKANTRNLRSSTHKIIEEIKASKDSIIHARTLENANLRNAVKLLDFELQISESRYDSLELVKSEIKTVYIEKIKEIETFNSKELEKYWKDEFN
jgi:hypothetical protein